MFTFPVVRSLDKLSAYFNAIKVEEVPRKFTYRFFSSVCKFTSSQDRDFVNLLRFLGFISADGVPTDAYMFLRDATLFHTTLYSCIQTNYKTVLVSQVLTHASLVSEFLKQTAVSHSTAVLYTDTLLALLSLSGHPFVDAQQVPDDTSMSSSSEKHSSFVNLNLTLPTTTDKAVYTSLFEALFKYIKD